MVEFPSGTVTFLFTDIEESTYLWERHPKVMQSALRQHDTLIQAAAEEHGGIIVKHTGDGFYAVFSSPDQGLQAAVDAQRHLLHEEWDPAINAIRVRMGLHTGTAESRAGDYFGRTVNRAARICSAAHGGQILLSSTIQALAVDDLPAKLSLLDMGEHQLKGLINREHLYQLQAPDLPADFPPLQSTGAARINLPFQATPFLGREHHRAALFALLQRDDVRLVTLSGPGGTGKTRLSLAVAEDLLPVFSDGVAFIELASIDDPALVIRTIATELELKSSPRMSTKITLMHYLRDRQMLLVLDNFEQIVVAAPKVAELLAAPRLKILVTSREILRLRGEHEYPVPPLELPSEKRTMTAAVLAQNEAVALFHQRARAATPTFLLTEENAPVVTAICRRLDGLPLAIELAAARLRMMPPGAILSHLEQRLPFLKGGPRDAPARQRTIRDTINWSYNLLNETEKELFALLSVFVGGWTLDAAEAVCGEGAPLDVFEDMASLRDKSLIQQTIGVAGDTRFTMLETVREYASERLRASDGRDSALGRHARYYADVANEDPLERVRQLGPEAYGAQFLEDYDNMRAVMRRASDAEDATTILRTGAGNAFLWEYLSLDARVEGMTWMKRALKSDRDVDPLLRARALYTLADISLMIPGHSPEAEMYIQESLDICREHDNPEQVVASLNRMANINQWMGKYEVARTYYEEALMLAQKQDMLRLAAMITGNIGDLLNELGEDEQAREWTRQAVEQSIAAGEDGPAAFYATNSAALEMRRGNYESAREIAENSLQHLRQYGQSHYISWPLHVLAQIAIRQGDLVKARASLTESVNILREYHGDESAIGALETMADLQLTQRQWESAANLLGSVEILREEVAQRRAPMPQAEQDARMAQLHENLSREVLQAAWRQGEKLSWEDALGLALELLESD